MESKLRSFACLTKSDVIGIEYNNQVVGKETREGGREGAGEEGGREGGRGRGRERGWGGGQVMKQPGWDKIVLVCLLQIYELKVLDTKPADAVSIIECDMKVNVM